MLEFNLRIGEMPYAPYLIVLMTECIQQSLEALAPNIIAVESAGAKYACMPPSAIDPKLTFAHGGGWSEAIVRLMSRRQLCE